MAYQRKLPILSTLHLLPDAVLNDLEQHSSAPPPINWQKFARDHNVPGDNCVKEFAEKSGDGRQPGSKRKRHLCGGVPVPVPPTVKKIQESWTEQVRTGEMSPCSPFTLVSYNVCNGDLEKFPLR